MSTVRIDVGCPGTVVLVNTENPREYSIDNRCQCGRLGRDAARHPEAVVPPDDDLTGTTS